MKILRDKLVFTAERDQMKKYFFLPFTVPEDVETLELDFRAYGKEKVKEKEKNKLDVGLISPDGNQVGTTGQKVTHIVLSERYASTGYHPVTPVAGEWKILVGVAECQSCGLKAEFDLTYTLKQPRWLKGDTHSHTFHSDGAYDPKKLFKNAKKKGLDYLIITDHNNNVAGQYYGYSDKDLLHINGYELTSFNGHVNLWGKKYPLDLPFAFNTAEEYKKLYAQARERGCVVSVNHPTCKKCGWTYWKDDTADVCKRDLPDDVAFDCCEVWNGPMRIDNVTAIGWWHEQLLKGRRLPAVGGSDYHQNYAFVNLLANPTTYVYARSNTTEDVLNALKAGRSFITHSPTSTQMYLTVDGKIPGETAVWREGLQAELRIIKPKRGHRLVVYNNDKVVFQTVLPSKKETTYRFDLPEKGFVRAEILYNYNFIVKTIYKRVIPILMPKDKGLPIPEFYWALTNPVWLE